MASIKPRLQKDGTTSYLITVSCGRDSSGKQILKYITFIPKSKAPTKAEKELNAFVSDFEQRAKAGDLPEGDKVTFEAFAKIWEKNWLPAKTQGVQERYKDILRIRVFPEIGFMKLTSIRATHIDKIIADELAPKDKGGKGLAPKTVRDTFTVINSVLRYALKKQYIRENPCLRCDDLPSVEMRTGEDLQFFNEDQARRFMNDALTMDYQYSFPERHRKNKKTGEKITVKAYTVTRKIDLMWRVYFTMAIYTTMREGEMCGLTWNDIDFEKQTIKIYKSLARSKEIGQYIKDPKTKAGIREIYIPSALVALLKSWKQEQTALCVKLGTAWKGHRNGLKDDGKTPDCFDDNTVFIQNKAIGQPLNLSSPGHKFHEIIDLYNATCENEADKLPHIRLHDLRHTGATLLLGNNTDIETVSKRLGHAKASVTLDIYGHALPENDKVAAETLEAMLKGS